MPRSSARPASRSEAGERGSTPCSRSEKPECPDRKVVGAGFTNYPDVQPHCTPGV